MMLPRLLFSVFFLAANAQAAENLAPAADSVFRALQKMPNRLPERFLPAGGAEGTAFFVQLDAGDPWTLGVVRVIRVHAPASRLVQVVEDVPGYASIITGVLSARAEPEAEGKALVIYAETYIPIPFVANDRTKVRYQIEKQQGRRSAAARLVESNHLNGLDGASLLVPIGKEECAYLQVNFMRMGFGASRALPPKIIWREYALGGLQADWAFKLKAEKPTLAPDEILKQSQASSRAEEGRIQEAYSAPRTLDQLLAELRQP